MKSFAIIRGEGCVVYEGSYARRLATPEEIDEHIAGTARALADEEEGARLVEAIVDLALRIAGRQLIADGKRRPPEELAAWFKNAIDLSLAARNVEAA